MDVWLTLHSVRWQ